MTLFFCVNVAFQCSYISSLPKLMIIKNMLKMPHNIDTIVIQKIHL